jgi:hypothetical protein
VQGRDSDSESRVPVAMAVALNQAMFGQHALPHAANVMNGYPTPKPGQSRDRPRGHSRLRRGVPCRFRPRCRQG